LSFIKSKVIIFKEELADKHTFVLLFKIKLAGRFFVFRKSAVLILSDFLRLNLLPYTSKTNTSLFNSVTTNFGALKLLVLEKNKRDKNNEIIFI
jgi:hypothetical protein